MNDTTRVEGDAFVVLWDHATENGTIEHDI